MMKRLIVMTFMVLGIYQALCFSSYSCEPTTIIWKTTHVDGKPVYFGYKDVVVRPGQFILFKARFSTSDYEFRKVNFKFTKIDSEEASYEETDTGNARSVAQVGIHWKVDGKIVKPGRYLVEVQVPYRDRPLQRCSESSNIISREVVFDPGDTPEEFEVEND